MKRTELGAIDAVYRTFRIIVAIFSFMKSSTLIGAKITPI
jgi:hypothetical protein